jgi:hypothetical protein
MNVMSFDQTILAEFTSFINKTAAAMQPLNIAPSPAPEASSLLHPQVQAGAALPRRAASINPVNNSTSGEVQNPSEGPGGGGPKPVTASKQPLSMSGSFIKKN